MSQTQIRHMTQGLMATENELWIHLASPPSEWLILPSLKKFTEWFWQSEKTSFSSVVVMPRMTEGFLSTTLVSLKDALSWWIRLISWLRIEIRSPLEHPKYKAVGPGLKQNESPAECCNAFAECPSQTGRLCKWSSCQRWVRGSWCWFQVAYSQNWGWW